MTAELITDYLKKGIILIIADVFSLITIASCLVIKVPQINMIRENQSSKGVSVVGLSLELFSYTVTMSYYYLKGYELLSYMEYPILLLQEYALIYYTFKYQNLLGPRTQMIALAYLIIGSVIYMKLFPISVITFFVPFTTPIGATSKILQLLAILKSKDSSSVSCTTWALSAFTNMTRIYTVYVESADKMLLANFGISTILSTMVLTAAYVFKKDKRE